MSEHLSDEAIARLADGEDSERTHVAECARCANALIGALQLKRAVREAVPRFEVPERLRARILEGRRGRRHYTWLAAAAAVLLIFAGAAIIASRRAATRELIDLHTTVVGSASPIDVVSTDRHTVKPWFEGRVPFAVDVPELAGTPFRLAGGRVVFWRGRPGAYLLITKGGHRISLFEFPVDTMPRLTPTGSMTIVTWSANGLAYDAVGDV